MKTVFARPSWPRAASPPWARPWRPASLAGPSLGQFDIDSLNREIGDLLGQLPADLTGRYREEYERCRRLISEDGTSGLVAGGSCLYRLFQELKAVVRGQQQAPQPLPRQAPPPSGGFPVLPLAIAGAAGLALVLALTQLKG